MKKIAENFTICEFSVSERYPALATGVPAQLHPNVIALVRHLLQPLRTATGWRCRITSGYRSPELNAKVGGAPTSQHLKAEAADTQWFDAAGRQIPTINVLIKAVELRLPFDQMIAYPSFVHFSHTTARENRRQTLYNKNYKGRKI